ncbi:MAG: homocysteine biosynthesis protein [Jaaginema sp. PMC 1079.18]|nr:homocysteine biosynthesis protein [Jaaginema sp. PMC 1080.18]MEC4849494.1 homocysteine biosynthesis protein [Jaaginema sp. PMC 1079.18]MEC4866003.1 homocysteine biosynthesis protein [Jaaginema sp. PMC 1078.18]
MRTIAEINEKIRQRQAVVWTIEEAKAKVAEMGVKAAARQVDVVVTGTFEPMESTGAMLNLGHTDPPIKIRTCWLDDVPAYAGLGAVDLYLGATMTPEPSLEGGEVLEARENKMVRGGGHVIEDLIAGKPIRLRARGQVTDCYPRATLDTTISRETINQFYLFNPRNLYQNFIVGVNGGDRILHTYLGPLHPRLSNAVYSNPGEISPLFNDPHLDLIGIGSRLFLGGGVGYVAWEGTQHFPLQKRLPNGTPIGPAATLALIGDAKQMQARWVRGCYFKNYGPSIMLGVGIPFPILHEEAIASMLVRDEDIVAPVVDFAIPRRVRPTFGLVSYGQLKSGKIKLEGKTIRTAPLASVPLSRQVAAELKAWILNGQFTLSEAVAPLPRDRTFIPQESWGGVGANYLRPNL